MYRLLILLASAICLVPSAQAADIGSRDLGDGVHLITIIGDIEAGDDVKFRALTLRHEKAIVALASDGGTLSPALEIGRLINLRGYFTAVFEGFACSSACALIWTAGAKRFLHPAAKLGFHASYYESGGQKIEGGIGNALVGRYLTQLGMSERTIVFATMASPDSITWLTAANASPAGIEFETLNSSENKTPLPLRSFNQTSTDRTGWQAVEQNRTLTIYMDQARLGRIGSYRTAWERWDQSRDPDVSQYSAMNLYYYDCSRRRSALKQYIHYGKEGERLGGAEIPDTSLRWYNVVPESIGETTFEFACRN